MIIQTRNDQADTALRWRKPPSPVQRRRSDPQMLEARQNITGGFALDLAGNGKLANYLGLIAFYGLPFGLPANLHRHHERRQPEQVKTALAAAYQPTGNRGDRRRRSARHPAAGPAGTDPQTPPKPARSPSSAAVAQPVARHRRAMAAGS